MQFFSKTNIDFVGKRKSFFILSISVIVAGIISIFALGIDYGIDFVGGTEMAVEFQKPIQTEQIRKAIEVPGLTGTEIKSFGQENQFLIRLKESGDAPTIVDSLLKSKFPDYGVQNLKVDKIGPKIGAELRNQAFIAVFLSIIAILLYIGFRFEITFGLGAIVALIHDVLITFSLIVVIHQFGLIDLEVNQSILAAMLTVVGYSINNTVIIFDRIRENKDTHKGMNFLKLVNLSINDTLSRTVNTVVTVFLVLVTLTLFGGPVLQGFTLTMLIGVLVGTYSSFYISNGFVIFYLEKVKKINFDASSSDKKAIAKA